MAIDPVTAIANAVAGATNFATGIVDYSHKKRLADKTSEYGGRLADYYTGMSQDVASRKYSNTAYGQYLERMSKEGIYSAGEEQSMLSSIARSTGGATEEAKQEYFAALASRGMEGSVAAARGINEISDSRVRAMSEAEEKITMAESQAKRQAAEEYARLTTEYAESNRNAADEYRRQALVSKYGLELEALGLKGEAASAMAGGIGAGVGAAAYGYGAGVATSRENEAWQQAIKAAEGGDFSLMSLLMGGTQSGR